MITFNPLDANVMIEEIFTLHKRLKTSPEIVSLDSSIPIKVLTLQNADDDTVKKVFSVIKECLIEERVSKAQRQIDILEKHRISPRNNYYIAAWKILKWSDYEKTYELEPNIYSLQRGLGLSDDDKRPMWQVRINDDDKPTWIKAIEFIYEKSEILVNNDMFNSRKQKRDENYDEPSKEPRKSPEI